MARNFRELEERMSPESRSRSDTKTQKLADELTPSQRQSSGDTSPTSSTLPSK